MVPGQFGQVRLRSSVSGGRGMISIWFTQRAPWRIDGAHAVGAGVAAADDDDPPVEGADARLVGDVLAGHAPVLLDQEVHREVHAGELAPGHRQIARVLGAAGEHHRVVLVEQLRRPGSRRRRARPARSGRPRPASATCAGRCSACRA